MNRDWSGLRWPVFLIALLGLASQAAAKEPFRYPEARHGPAELRYINHVPVLFVEGTPEEIGEQVAELGLKPSGQLLNYPKDVLNQFAAGFSWKLFVLAGKRLERNFPADYRREMEAMVRTGVDPERLVTANTMFDVVKLIACSSMIVQPERSATGKPIFGRNLDFPTAGYLQEYSVVLVCRPKGKYAFVSVGFPGLIGCLSGINEKGLCLAVHEVLEAADGSKKYDPDGVPYAMNYRRILEECATVEEAEKMLRSLKRTTRNNLAVCDRNGGVVFELTPKNVVVRRANDGLCPCTNHFCTKELAPAKVENRVYTCDRFNCLVRNGNHRKRLGLEEIKQMLHEVNGGDMTLQTMIFEPVDMKLHVALGSCPSSALPLRPLDVAELLNHRPAKADVTPSSPLVPAAGR
ncbi:MAG: C45 family peptidase [Gemmatales bacterium]|nr:C45 family peptidase [Gemmatales bacterium]MDW8387631.1 C45 family peptidase [Gemmatales bacterium]